MLIQILYSFSFMFPAVKNHKHMVTDVFKQIFTNRDNKTDQNKTCNCKVDFILMHFVRSYKRKLSVDFPVNLNFMNKLAQNI